MAISGKDYSPRISLVTNHWSERSTNKYQQEEKREQQYKEKFWSDLIESKAHLFRLELPDNGIPPDGNPICPQRAEEILYHAAYGSLWDPASMPQMQAEIVRQKKKIGDTEAGGVVEKEMKDRLAEVRKKKDQARKAQDLDELRRLNEESRHLKSSLAKLHGSFVGRLFTGF